jgi:hypothetical protein
VLYRSEDGNILLRRSRLSQRRISLRNERLTLLDETFKRIDFCIDLWTHFILISINLSRCSAAWAKRIRRIDFSRTDRSNFFSIISQFNSLSCYLQPESVLFGRCRPEYCTTTGRSKHLCKSWSTFRKLWDFIIISHFSLSRSPSSNRVQIPHNPFTPHTTPASR